MTGQVSSTPEAQDVRAKTEALANRPMSDANFARKLKDDPINTLRDEGLPERALQELNARASADVEGYCLGENCYYYTDIIPFCGCGCGYYTS